MTNKKQEERKTYKKDDNNSYNMLPGNLQGLPDESFSLNLFLEGFK